MVGVQPIAVQPSPTHRISLVRATNGDEWLAEVEGFPQLTARAASPEEAARQAWAAIEASIVEPRVDGDDGSPRRAPSHSGKLLVRMPATLHDELAHAAEREGVSLNQLITGVLASSVAWRTQARVDADAATRSHGLTRAVLAANFAVVLLAAVIALALLMTAWLG
jgi:predicted HicB family RNase H-like nuclease